MSLTPTQLSELQTIVEAFRGEFPNSDDAVWQAAIRMQKGGLGPVTGAGGQAAFDIALAEIVVCADQISTVQGRQGGPGSSLDEAVFQVVPVEDNLPAGALGDIIYLDMAPNVYLATGVISIVPAGPNSVTLAEVGTDVARTVPAASGGIEVNNLATGAGFERVLTTADVSAVVNAGTVEGQMLRWDDVSGEYDPMSELIADVPGAFELVSQLTYVALGGINLRNANGDVFLDNVFLGGGLFQYSIAVGGNDAVTLRDNGLAQFGMSGGTENTTLISGVEVRLVRNGLDEIALSLAPAAGGLSVNNTLTGAGLERVLTTSDLSMTPDPLTIGRIIITNTNDPDLVDTVVPLNIGAVNPDVSQHIEIGNSDIQSKGSNTTTGQLNLNAVGGNIFIGAQTGAGNVRIFNNGEDVFQTIAQGIQVLGAETNDPSTGGTQRTFINLQNNIGALTTFLGHGIAATTDCILRNAVRSGLMTIEGVDSGNANTPLFRGDPDGQAEMFNDGTSVARTLGAAAGGLEINNTLTAAGFERAATISDVVAGAFDPTADEIISGSWEFTHALGLNLGVSCELRLRNNADTATTFIQNLGPTLQFGIAGADFGSGIFEIGSSWLKVQINRSIFFDEKAAQGTPVAGDGEFWVRNDVPNTPMFTDDAGTDFELNAAGAVSISGTPVNNQLAVWTGAATIEGDAGLTYSGTILSLGAGDNLDFSGVMQIREGIIDLNGLATGLRILGQDENDDGISLSDGARVTWEDRASANHVYLENEGVGGGSGTLTMRTDSSANLILAGPGLQINNSALTEPIGISLLTTTVRRLNISQAIRTQHVVYMTERASANSDFAADGQFWVRNDVPNTPMFTDDAGNDFVLNSGGGAASEIKVKTANQTVNNSITLVADNHLTGFALVAGERYKFHLEGEFVTSATASMDFDIVFTNAPQAGGRKITGTINQTALGDYENNPLESEERLQGAAGTQAFRISGWFQANASVGGTVGLEWAQGVATVENTQILASAWMEVTQTS